MKNIKFLTKKYGVESLLIFTAPIHRIYFDIGFALKPFYIVIMFIMFIAIVKKNNTVMSFKMNNTLKLMFWFVLSIAIATLMNGAHLVSFRHIIVLALVMSGAYLIYIKINTFDDMQRITKIYLLAGLLFGITGLFFYGLFFINPALCAERSIFEGVTYESEKSWVWPLLQSIDVGSNAYAMSLIPFLFIPLGVLISEKKVTTKIYAGIIFLLLLLNLFLTFSRGGMVAFFVAGFLMIITNKQNPKMKWFFVALVVVFSLSLAPYLQDIYISYSVMKGAYSGEGSDLMSSRGELFFSSIKVFLENPVFGVGQGVISDPAYVGKQSHNTYVELLAENGVIPFLLFSIILTSLFRKILYMQKQVRSNKQYYFCTSFIFGMIGLLIAAIPTSAITMTLLWVHMAILLAFYKVIRIDTCTAKACIEKV